MANSKDNQNQNSGGNNQSGKSERGFASMDSERQREIAAEGGRAAHASGNAHEFNSQEAREAGSRSHSGGSNSTSNSGSNSASNSASGNTRGGSSEQHARAGSQSRKNDR
ncbi:stress-induced protein [Acidovorax sp. LjRoot129]|uniref:KGG domain-containing protein n=1 Tax=Acidovorax sp. LjRoot129 TaxID=3342260 RepID=UPI003ED16436